MSEEQPTTAEIVGPPPNALRAIGIGALWTVLSAVSGALATFAAEHAAELSAAIMSLTSGLPAWAVGLVTAGITALLGLARQKAQKAQQEKLVKALATPPPADIEKYYTK